MPDDQNLRIDGDNSIGVQVMGENISVTVGKGSQPVLIRPETRKARASTGSDLELLNAYRCSIPLVGRDDNLQSLKEWLASDKDIAVRTMIGRAGAGKTRLAIELITSLPEKDWNAGFITSEEVAAFPERVNLSKWTWQKPTLIVVDHAATLLDPLSRWLRELADHPKKEDAPRLRLLLLERQAKLDGGWYQSLFSGGDSNAGVPSLFEPVKPLPVQALDLPEKRRAVLKATLREACGEEASAVPEPGENPEFDKRLQADQWQDPLYLMMAALVATHTGVVEVLALGRRDLAFRVAGKELARIRKFSPKPNAADFLAHIAAYATLCGGLDGHVVETVTEEMKELGVADPHGPKAVADRLVKALPGNPGVAAIEPDIVGEAVTLSVLGEYDDHGTATLVRAQRRAGPVVTGRVIHAAQDFCYDDPYGRDTAAREEPLEWLRALIQEGQAINLGLLLEIDAAMPYPTLALREPAAAVTELLLERLPQAMEGLDETDFLAERSRILNNLAARLRELGQREEALARAEEAMGIRRKLAAERPDAFLPDLAMSLGARGSVLLGLERYGEAANSFAEGLQSITPQFLKLPAAFGRLVVYLAWAYPEACQRAGREPDAAVLGPVAKKLAELQSAQGEEGSDS